MAPSRAEGDVEHQRGALPIILCAPHGGRRRPATIADRPHGNLKNDVGTQELARAIARALTTGGEGPHLVVNHLHRRKLDPNRPFEAGTAGDPRAEAAWAAYHGFVERAQQEVLARHGRGLLLDIHGHAHVRPWVQLGYLIDSSELALDDETLDGLAAQSSIRSLAERGPSSFAELVRGPTSLGARLAASGFDAVPSPDNPSPGDEPYFKGGYTVRRHGSRDGGTIDAIQLEAHREGIRDTGQNRTTFAIVVARALRHILARTAPTRLSTSSSRAGG